MEEGERSNTITMTIPVTAHIITVSQKVAVMEISACLGGLLVFAVEAAIPAEPKPASLVNNPRAIPYRQAFCKVAPRTPPAMEVGTKADFIIKAMDGPKYLKFNSIKNAQPNM